MYMYKKIFFLFVISTILVLTACNSKVVEEAKKIEEESSNKENEEEILEKQLEELEKNKVTVEDAVENINKQREEKKTLEAKYVEEKESFTDIEEFSQYVARILYEFFVYEITAEEYYDFLTKHGSRVLLKNMDPQNKDVIIEGYNHAQNLLKQEGVSFQGYSLSETTLDETGIYGYFYRSLHKEDGTETHYITTIVKEGNEWKFDKDNLSAGYNEEKEGKEG